VISSVSWSYTLGVGFENAQKQHNRSGRRTQAADPMVMLVPKWS
jgi:hypothetical protein